MLLTGAAGQSAVSLRDAFPTVSLRFAQALDKQDIKRLTKYLPDNSLGITQLAFWTQRQAAVKNERNNRETETSVICFSGDGHLVWPQRFLYGGYPGVGDRSGCAVSAGLADQIFGSTDVAGLPVLIADEPYLVRGVWDSPEPLVMLQPAASGAMFENLEVLLKTDRDYREAAMDLARDNQLSPTATINGPVIGAAGVLAGNLPFYLAGILLLFKIAGVFLAPRTGLRVRMTAALLAFTILLLLCGLHAKIPDYLIPTKWSDFTYWGRLAADYRDQLIELLSLTPTDKDLFFRLQALRLGGCLLAAMTAVAAYLPYALRRWQGPAARTAVFMHLIWMSAAWFCVWRMPLEIRLAYLLCFPFLALPLLRRTPPGISVPRAAAAQRPDSETPRCGSV